MTQQDNIKDEEAKIIERICGETYNGTVFFDEQGLYQWTTLVCGQRTLSKKRVSFDYIRFLSDKDILIYSAMMEIKFPKEKFMHRSVDQEVKRRGL